jgi:hypothetical protein
MGQLDFEYGYNDPDYKTDDPPSYSQACMGMMVCPHCGKAAMCGDVAVNPTLGEQDDMIPRGSGNSGGGNTGRRSGKKGSGLRYLSADMLTTTHQLANIADARVQDDNFGKDRPQVVVVKLRFKGEFILWTLRSNNPSLEVLGDAFGDDETKWNGRDIELYIEEDTFDGKKWIRCDAISGVATESKRVKK